MTISTFSKHGPVSTTTFREITLEQRVVTAVGHIALGVIACAEPPVVDACIENEAQTLAIAIRQKVFAYNWRRESVTFPVTWWDAVKQRWFPKWALRRWPAQMKTVELRTDEVFPKLMSNNYAPRLIVLDKQERFHSWDPEET